MGSPEQFDRRDPHLRRLEKLPLVHRPSLLRPLLTAPPGIYTLGGGRQIGKTTALKQWMSMLLAASVPPECIRYVSGELIDDHHSLCDRYNNCCKKCLHRGRTI